MLLQTPTPNIEMSLDFYRRLKFETIKSKEKIYVTDGKAVIKINEERYARPGIILHRPKCDELVNALQKYAPVFEIENGYVLADSTGTWIYLMKGEAPDVQTKGECHSVLGNYAGVSLETISMTQSSALWAVLGLKITMGGPDEGWMTMGDDDGNTISFMHPNSCPHLFYNPSLTYFNGGNNLQVIQDIRAAEVPITEEITHFNKKGEVDNVILRDPGGFGFFVFND